MYWTLELASWLEDAPWPATKDELIDFAMRSGAPMEVIENLQEIEDEGESYETIEEIWPDYPSKDDFFFNEDDFYQYAKIHTCYVIFKKGASVPFFIWVFPGLRAVHFDDRRNLFRAFHLITKGGLSVPSFYDYIKGFPLQSLTHIQGIKVQ